ncbi:MAG TPA: diacylglycerol kinase family protein [Terriglobales bacterium]|nr:diacylglycerol kinase family protein [Terriglobales bacterium]
MHRAVLLYNPRSGRKRVRRVADVEAAASVLRTAGVKVELVPTEGPGTAGRQAREAIAAGADAILACGGDGTVHDVLQGMITPCASGTGCPDRNDAALGIIPLGTANALAIDLGIPRNPKRAANWALQARPRSITVGEVAYTVGGKAESRYFTVAVGIGADAHLAYRMTSEAKGRLGMAAYYWRATHIWATHDFPPFEVEFFDAATSRNRVEVVSEVLAVRVTQFGGLLRELAPGAALKRNCVRLVLFKTRSRLRYLSYVLKGLVPGQRRVPGIELVDATQVECRVLGNCEGVLGWQPGQSSPPSIYVEADGEMLGRLPATISVVPNGLRLLMM